MVIHEEDGMTRDGREEPGTSLFSGSFFQTLLETIPAPIFFKDAQGLYLGCNGAFVDQLGRPREEIVGRTVHQIAPRELADIYLQQDQELFDNPGIQVYESRLPHADGSLHDVIFRKATFRGADGRVGGLVGVIFDITDRKHRIVADNTYDWEFWLKPSGRLEYCSPSCERITGHTRDEFMADPDLMLHIIHPEDQPLFMGHRHEVQDGQALGAREIQYRLVRPDGSLRWIGHICQPVFDREGTFLGIRGSNRDITEQRQAEEARHASEKRYRALIDEMAEGVALHELLCDESGAPSDFRFLETNPAFERLTGLKREEVIGRRVSDVIPSEASTWLRLSSEVALTGRSAHFENYVPTMKKHFEVSVYSPEPFQFAVLFADITERKRTERERDRLLSQLRAVIDHIDTGLMISDARGRILEMNPVARQMCGYASVEEARRHPVMSRFLFDLASMDGQPLTPRDWPRARTLRGEAFGNWELRVRRKDDGMEWICSLGGTPILDQAGHLAFTLLTLRDVTEHWKAQEVLERKVRERTEELDRALRTAELRAEQLRAMSLELAQAEQRERRRLAQILHDNLQQLLVGATFHVKVLKDALKSRTLRQTLGQLSETLTEALEVSRAMTTELSPPIFYEKGLSDGLEWLSHQMHKKHGLMVAIETTGNVEPEAEQIRMFLFEAVRELLLNIVKHAKVDHARVRVRALGSGELEITVADGGIGFDPTRLEEGGGFGLFNIREKLRFLHGRMEIESVPEGGSRFTLVVPCPKEGGRGDADRRKLTGPRNGGIPHADQDLDRR